ncbi:MAG: hypothetical protein HRU28_12625 [Rhizobiales bacterium]|nr:hypothetical protein [Hyphomicrobiales bacterium]
MTIPFDKNIILNFFSYLSTDAHNLIEDVVTDDFTLHNPFDTKHSMIEMFEAFLLLKHYIHYSFTHVNDENHNTYEAHGNLQILDAEEDISIRIPMSATFSIRNSLILSIVLSTTASRSEKEILLRIRRKALKDAVVLLNKKISTAV